MSYFIHNKYDKTSVSQLSAMETAGHTIIDYYGLLESGNTTYKYLDTKDMPCIVSSLSYVNIDKNNFIANAMKEDENCQFNFSSSIIVKSIQRGIGGITGITSTTENGVTVYSGTINIATIDPNKSIVLFNNGHVGRYGGGWTPAVVNLTANAIQIKETYTTNEDVLVLLSWQVIEFR